jgi:opacity protein-like surface antigen
MKKGILVVMIASVLAFGSVATADEFYGSVGIGINNSTGTDVDEAFDDNGFQGSIAFGNRVQEHIRVEAEYQYLDSDDLEVSSIMVGGAYDFGDWAGFIPYVNTAVGIGWFDAEDTYEHSAVWKLGGGVNYVVNDAVMVGMNYTYFDSIDGIDYDTDMFGGVITMQF